MKSKKKRATALDKSFWGVIDKAFIYEIYKKILAKTFNKIRAGLKLKSHCLIKASAASLLLPGLTIKGFWRGLYWKQKLKTISIVKLNLICNQKLFLNGLANLLGVEFLEL